MVKIRRNERMNKLVNIFTYGILVLCAIYIFLVIATPVYYGMTTKSHALKLINEAGGPGVVVRETEDLMLLYTGYSNVGSVSITVPTSSWPTVYTKLRARKVVVYRDHVNVFCRAPGRRIAFIVFPEDVPQYGTSMITNRLWYWYTGDSVGPRSRSPR